MLRAANFDVTRNQIPGFLHIENASSKQAQAAIKIAPLVVESNKRRKDIRQFEKDRAFRVQQREEEDFWAEYESDLVRDTSSDESSSDGGDEEDNDDKGYGERQAETGIDNLGLSVFQSGSEDYLCAVRRTGSLSIEKHERRRIRELEKAAPNSQSIKTIFANHQLRISQSPIPTDKSTVLQSLEKKDSEETINGRAVQDLSELMRLKTE